jgi:hypothetical protein
MLDLLDATADRLLAAAMPVRFAVVATDVERRAIFRLRSDGG